MSSAQQRGREALGKDTVVREAASSTSKLPVPTQGGCVLHAEGEKGGSGYWGRGVQDASRAWLPGIPDCPKTSRSSCRGPRCRWDTEARSTRTPGCCPEASKGSTLLVSSRICGRFQAWLTPLLTPFPLLPPEDPPQSWFLALGTPFTLPS